MALSTRFEGTPYSTYGAVGGHLSSDWEVYSDSSLTTLVYSSYDNTSSLTVWYTDLDYSEDYCARVRYHSTNGVTSPWSDAKCFVTAEQVAIDTPTITYPANGTIGLFTSVAYASSAFTLSSGTATHAYSDWELYSDAAMTTLVASAYDQTTQLTSWLSTVGVFGETYYARVRYKASTGEVSDWSPLVNYTVMERPYQLAIIGSAGTSTGTVTFDIVDMEPGASYQLYLSYDKTSFTPPVSIPLTLGTNTINLSTSTAFGNYKTEIVYFTGVKHIRNFSLSSGVAIQHLDWGIGKWSSLESMYKGVQAANGDGATANPPDLSQCTSLSRMLQNSTNVNIKWATVNQWDVSNITDFSHMFNGSNSFSAIKNNLKNWNVSSGTNFSYMFANPSLTTVSAWDISGWIPPTAVTNIDGMFKSTAYTNFTTNIGTWDISRCTTLKEVFYNCFNFNEDVTQWDVSKVTDYTSLFYGCSKFNQDIGPWAVNAATVMDNMLYACSVFNQDLSEWCVSRITTEPPLFNDFDTVWTNTAWYPQWGTCPGLVVSQPTSWALKLDNTGSTSRTLNFYRTDSASSFSYYVDGVYRGNISTAGTVGYPIPPGSSIIEFVADAGKNLSVKISNGLDLVTDVLQWGSAPFYNTNCQGFNNLAAVSAIDAPDLLTAGRGNAINFFNGCGNLKNIVNIANWDVSNCISFIHMFEGCTSLTSLNVANWDVSTASNMYAMFAGVPANMDVSGWDVSSCINMGDMFMNCANFNQPLASWDVSKVTMFSRMFNGATSFDQPIGVWDVSSATEMISMFYGATSFNQDLSTWCVQNISTKPSFFDQNSTAWLEADWRPGWGTCPARPTGMTITLAPSNYESNQVYLSTAPKAKPGTTDSVSFGDGAQAVFDEFGACKLYVFADKSSQVINKPAILPGTVNLSDGSIVTFNTDGSSSIYHKYVNGFTGTATFGFNFNVVKFVTTSTPSNANASITAVTSWGSLVFENIDEMFLNCLRIASWPTDGSVFQITSNVTSMNRTFQNCAYVYDWSFLTNLDVSNVTSMVGTFMFTNPKIMNLNSWDVTNVQDFTEVFREVHLRNAPDTWTDFQVWKWDTSHITDPSKFYNAVNFWGESKAVYPLWGFNGADQELIASVVTSSSNQEIQFGSSVQSLQPEALYGGMGKYYYPVGIDWGDGSVELIRWPVGGAPGSYARHTYATAGSYTVKFYRHWHVPARYSSYGTSGIGITGITKWGCIPRSNFEFFMFGNPNLTTVACEDVPVFSKSGGISFHRAFESCANFVSYENMEYWDMSKVAIFHSMFSGSPKFNHNISSWQVYNATDMQYMLALCTQFNQDLSQWCVSQFPSRPTSFGDNTTAWTLPKPGWGTCLSRYGLSSSDVFAIQFRGDALGIQSLKFGFGGGTIDWGDGTVDTHTEGTIYATHIYSSPGTYVIEITNMKSAKFAAVHDFDVVQWGTTPIESVVGMFQNSGLVDILAGDIPNLNLCTSFESVFDSATNYTGSGINLFTPKSAVTTLKNCFRMCNAFNGNLTGWDTRFIKSFEGTFEGATIFNQNISSWIVRDATNFTNMFKDAKAFNQDISVWDTYWAQNFDGMFSGASAFNQDIGNWEVERVTSMTGMFLGATAFNHDLSYWCVRNIATKPVNFDFTATSWVAARPGWGTCPKFEEALVIDISIPQSNLNSYYRGFVFDYPTPVAGKTITIDWGDGTVETIDAYKSWVVHEYANVTKSYRIYVKNAAALSFTSSSRYGNTKYITEICNFGSSNLWTRTAWLLSTNNYVVKPKLSAKKLYLAPSCDSLAYFCGSISVNKFTAEEMAPILSSLDVSNITNMYKAFFGANLSLVDFSNWDTSKVCTMARAFQYAKIIYNTTMGNLDTGRVGNMNYAFANAVGVDDNVDLTKWSAKHCDNYRFDYNITASSGWTKQPIWGTSPVATDYDNVAQPTAGRFAMRVFGGSQEFIINDIAGSAFKLYIDGVLNRTMSIGSYNTITLSLGDHLVEIEQVTPTTPATMKIFRSAGVYEIVQWGNINLSTYEWFINSGRILSRIPFDHAPNLANCTSLYRMLGSGFEAAVNNGGYNLWDVSNVQSFEQLFYYVEGNITDISGWDTSSATNMTSMFVGASGFNQDLSGWCVTNITSLPTGFDSGLTTWTLPRPVWGTCPP